MTSLVDAPSSSSINPSLRRPTQQFRTTMMRSLVLFGAFLCHTQLTGAFTVSKTGKFPKLIATKKDTNRRGHEDSISDWSERVGLAAATTAFSLSIVLAPMPAFADGQTKEFKFPPIDFSDKNRCKLNSSSMGQANAARDKLYDLRQCDLVGVNAAGFDLSGVST